MPTIHDNRQLPPRIKALIRLGCSAHLITLDRDRDGGPQVTLIWVGLDGDEQGNVEFADEEDTCAYAVASPT